MELIDKDKIVAELKRLIAYSQNMEDNAINSSMQQFFDGMKEGYTDVLSSIQSIETKEVDLEKEFYDFLDTLIGKDNGHLSEDELFSIAEHFYELGLKANNPTTAADRGIAEEIIVNLKRIEQDYCIDLTKEMQWLRDIVKKGE